MEKPKPTFFFFPFISWRLITLQYCSGFCRTLTGISHGFTCIPHPDPPLPPPSPPDSSGLYLPCISFFFTFDFIMSLYFISCNQHKAQVFQSIVLQSMSFHWQDSNIFCFMVFLGFFKNLFLSSIFPLFSCFLYFSTSFLSWDRGICVLSVFIILAFIFSHLL